MHVPCSLLPVRSQLQDLHPARTRCFCLGVFSGDDHDCIPWSEYSANPTSAYHSTTLIFTPGNYSLSERSSGFSVANIKTFIMIGDRTQLQFQLSLSNIGYVGMHNLSFLEMPSSSRLYIRDVHHFIMENCILSKVATLSFSTTLPINSLVNIANSTFEKVLIDVYSSGFTTTLNIDSSTFSAYLGRAITGDYYSSVIIQASQFTNNFVTSANLVYTQY